VEDTAFEELVILGQRYHHVRPNNPYVSMSDHCIALPMQKCQRTCWDDKNMCHSWRDLMDTCSWVFCGGQKETMLLCVKTRNIVLFVMLGQGHHGIGGRLNPSLDGISAWHALSVHLVCVQSCMK